MPYPNIEAEKKRNECCSVRVIGPPTAWWPSFYGVRLHLSKQNQQRHCCSANCLYQSRSKHEHTRPAVILNNVQACQSRATLFSKLAVSKAQSTLIQLMTTYRTARDVNPAEEKRVSKLAINVEYEMKFRSSVLQQTGNEEKVELSASVLVNM